ncbi:MAG: hypothetical protein HQL87_04635 [Magnetococcales bacterium]|nr:hypothetical protein [Magnetococcales bacterium]
MENLKLDIEMGVGIGLMLILVAFFYIASYHGVTGLADRACCEWEYWEGAHRG